MADLLSHYTVGHIGGKFLKAEDRIFVYIGCVIPDLVYKLFLYGTGSSTLFCDPSHSPIVLVLISYVLAMLFEESIRKKALVLILIGSYTHVLLDLGKDYLGSGVVPLLFPFSLKRVELGLYENHDSIYFMILCLALIATTEAIIMLVRGKAK